MDTTSTRRPVSVSTFVVWSLASVATTFVVWSLASVALGQVTTSNPIDNMKAVVEEVLDDAGVPFTDQQNRELALVMSWKSSVGPRAAVRRHHGF